MNGYYFLKNNLYLMDLLSPNFNVVKILNFHQKWQRGKKINLFIRNSIALNFVLIPVTVVKG